MSMNGISRRALALALGGAAASCNRNRKKVIGVIPQGRSHMFWQTIHAGANKAGRENGVDILWNAPLTETDYNGQLQIVDSMINRHVDAIALSPIDKKAMVSSVERAVKQGIPVIIFDTGVDTDVFTARVATDNYGAGQMAAARMGEVLSGKGKVIMVACQPGAASSIAREKGFEDAIRKFPGIEIVDKRFGWSDFAKSLQVAENMLTAHPEATGVFASNETSSVGASQAVKARRRKVALVGFDYSPTLLSDLRDGIINSLVVQNPFLMGYQAVMLGVTKLKGETPKKLNDLPPRLVTRENLNDADIQAQLNPDLKKYLD
ncbi:MAG: substrate-binding domain-containing protein [Acidobacteria bacterium]|nr:substrate-binding domain-containing protein [Acidobacteriota bacterium]